MEDTSVNLFAIPKEQFFKDFENVLDLKSGLYKYVFQFPIVIPFYMAIPTGMYMTSEDEDNNKVCSFFFTEVEEDILLNLGAIGDKGVKQKVKKTRVEMFYINSEEIEDNQKSINIAFRKLLDALNTLIYAYLHATQDTNAYYLDIEQLPFVCFCKILDISKNTDILSGVYHLNLNLPEVPKLILPEALLEVQRYFSLLKDNVNPFMIISESLFSAYRNLRNHNNKDAIIHMQTYIELFLKTLIIQLEKEDGKLLEDIERELEELPFMKMVKTKFHPKISGNWDVTQINTPTSQWYNDTYLIRNRIIHGGYDPTDLDTKLAVDSGEQFIFSIVDLLKVKNKEYPNVNKYFL